MSEPSIYDRYVRLSLGLPDPGVMYSDDLAHMAARAGLRLDSFTVSEQVRIEQVVRERDMAREQERKRDQERSSQSTEQRKSSGPKA